MMNFVARNKKMSDFGAVAAGNSKVGADKRVGCADFV
jgi:hypothetical protein